MIVTHIGPIIKIPQKSKNKNFDSAVRDVLESEKFYEIGKYFSYRYKYIVLIANEDYNKPLEDTSAVDLQEVDEKIIRLDLSRFNNHYKREVGILKKAYGDSFYLFWGISQFTEG